MSEQKPEGIRSWYARTTSKARKVLVWTSAVGIMAAGFFFVFAPQDLIEKIQQFNGAMTIPIFGLIWILGFIYMFLIPQREAGFRGQEWIENIAVTFQDSVDQKMAPAVKTWQNIGLEVEKELPGVLAGIKDGLKKASDTMDELRAAAKKIQEAVVKNEKVVENAIPAIEALKRIEAKIEAEIKAGLFENVQATLESVRGISGVPKQEEESPNLNWALESIRKNKAKAAGKV